MLNYNFIQKCGCFQKNCSSTIFVIHSNIYNQIDAIIARYMNNIFNAGHCSFIYFFLIKLISTYSAASDFKLILLFTWYRFFKKRQKNEFEQILKRALKFWFYSSSNLTFISYTIVIVYTIWSLLYILMLWGEGIALYSIKFKMSYSFWIL